MTLSAISHYRGGAVDELMPLARTLKAIYLKYGIGYRLSRFESGPNEGDWFVIVTYPDAAVVLVICTLAVLLGSGRAFAEAIGEDRNRESPHDAAKANVSETPNPEARKTGSTFSDCHDGCPEMVVMPTGQFFMGSAQYGREQPRHAVTFSKSFAVGKFAITFDEWMSCANGGGCAANKSPSDEGWGKGRHPVINVSWIDANGYVSWLSRKTGKEYRLLSEAEWEYVARAGSTASYPWGNAIDCGKASYDGGPGSSCHFKTGWWRLRGTQRVGRYAPNAWGLYDMAGNVWRWCEDSWHTNYVDAPTDGTAWHGGDESMSILRGGAWNYGASALRSADRNWFPRSGRTSFILPSCCAAEVVGCKQPTLRYIPAIPMTRATGVLLPAMRLLLIQGEHKGAHSIECRYHVRVRLKHCLLRARAGAIVYDRKNVRRPLLNFLSC